MKNLNLALQLPDAAMDALGEHPEAEARLAVAIHLFTSRAVSGSVAAQVAQMSRLEFYEALSARNVSPYNYPAEDLARDLDVARRTGA
jgi:predicted HTH domain antitoxin